MTSRRTFAAAMALALATGGSPAQEPAPSSRASAQAEPGDYTFGQPLDTEERAIVAALTPRQVEAIDAALLGDISGRWVKVAWVLADQLKSRPGIPDGVPLEYYWQRLRRLVDARALELQGDMRRARFSEVRRR